MANNIAIKDGGGNDVTVKSTDTAGVHAPHHNVDTLTTITNVVHIDDNSGNISIDDGGNTITVDGTVAVTDGAGTLTVDAPVATPVFVRLSDGSAAITTLPVSLASVPSHAVTNAGTFVTQIDGAALTALQLIDNPIKVDDAAFTAATDSVTVMGGIVTADSVDSGDAGALAMTTARALHVSVQGTATVTGAVTNAGTFATQVDGAALTALQLIDDPVFADDAAFTAATSKVMMVGGQYQSSPNALDDNDAGSMLLDSSHRLVVAPSSAQATISATPLVRVGIFDASDNQITSFGGAGGTSATDDAAFTAAAGSGTPIMGFVTTDTVNSGDVGVVGMDTDRNLKVVISAGTAGIGKLTANSGVDIGDVDVASIAAGDNNIGNVDVVTLPAVAGGAAQDAAITGNPVPIGLRASTATPSAMSGDADVVYAWGTRTGATVISGDNVDDAAFTPGTSRVVVIGAQADEGSTDSVDEGDAGALRMTLDRKLIVNVQPHTAGGATALKVLDNDETEDEIKATAGTLYTLYCFNSTNAILYTKLYNATAANTTVGTTVPIMTIPVPGNNDTDGAGVVLKFGPEGMNFGTALSIATTTGLADNDTGAPGANAMTLAGTYL